MECIKCGAEFEGNKCPYCGHAVEHSVPQAQNITIINNYGVASEQAVAVKEQEKVKEKAAVTSPKSKGMAMFLACLGFIGLGGMNRFYVGKTISAIVYFFTFGVFFLGTIYDIVQIKNGNFTDKDGLPLK